MWFTLCMLVLCEDSSWSNSTHSFGLTPLAPTKGFPPVDTAHFNMQVARWNTRRAGLAAGGTKAALTPPSPRFQKKKGLLPSSRTPDKRNHRQTRTHTFTNSHTPSQNKPLAAAVARRWGAWMPVSSRQRDDLRKLSERWVWVSVSEYLLCCYSLETTWPPADRYSGRASLCCVNFTSVWRRDY